MLGAMVGWARHLEARKLRLVRLRRAATRLYRRIQAWALAALAAMLHHSRAQHSTAKRAHQVTHLSSQTLINPQTYTLSCKP